MESFWVLHMEVKDPRLAVGIPQHGYLEAGESLLSLEFEVFVPFENK